ncbi:hypothetical protein QTQ03_16690 [Micromonospora sp. WMMA1363]|uniref:hypothetical protein n=1 Tax=Micromonospora sp. WMMA1363 TaxID=3053985 RepID=UPI00259CB1D0|nr:hypothetical protein [Micromonospora sp. WMMA1363]MDM4721157.1 hypothetical protein [Micromonospora sp. WMMA1363]
MDKDKLISPRIAEDDVEIPDVGTVRVRAVSRYSLLAAGKGVSEDKDPAVVERRMLVAALVDPPLTMAEAEQWQKSAPAGEIGHVLQRVRELSGLTEGAAKSGV